MGIACFLFSSTGTMYVTKNARWEFRTQRSPAGIDRIQITLQ